MDESIKNDLKGNKSDNILNYASDEDTYIRKNAYLYLARTYRDQESLQAKVSDTLEEMYNSGDEKIRQTAVYSWGEIGKTHAERATPHLEKALRDDHHSVRNAVLGSLKQMGQKNPLPTLEFAQRFLHDEDPRVRRIVVHGVELRGRTHPEEILPLLEEVQDEKDKEVRKTIIHVLGQISYKKGCLEKVVKALKTWNNRDLVQEALLEIIDVHKRYRFAAKSPEEAERYIKKEFKL